MRVDEWVRQAADRLRLAGVDTPVLDARVLLAHAMERDRSWLMTHPEALVPSAVDELLERRLTREPLAYILGSWEFYGRKFFVGPGVLVPRADTETVIEAALSLDPPKTILDIGTGSGCLAITLALEWPDAAVTAVDISPEALAYASRTTESLGAEVEFLESDMMSAVSGRQFDLIVSNPPYVAPGDELQREVQLFEPDVALYGGSDGYAPYHTLARVASRHLNPGGSLVIEFGDGMDMRIKDIFEESGWHVKHVYNDLSDRPRAMVLQLPEGLCRAIFLP